MLVLHIFDFLFSLMVLIFTMAIVSMFASFAGFALFGIFFVVTDENLSKGDRLWTTVVLTGLSAWGAFLAYQTYRLDTLLWQHMVHLVS